MNNGLTHLYIGTGKGKTTAAMGLALRALGAGERVYVCQFLKSGHSGELAMLVRLGATVSPAGRVDKFTFQMTEAEKEECAAGCTTCLHQAAAALAGGDYGLVLLDEVVDAVNCGMLACQEVLDALEAKSPATEAVLTGRNPDPRLVELCDYVTDMACVKHPYQQGIGARHGVEY